LPVEAGRSASTARPGRWDVQHSTGEMVIVRSLGDDEVALIAYEAHFARAEFIAIAESISLP
jgi:hypothetical protein